ncbi:hypothetical protein PYCCODRAFT_1467403 [Trametes coccinea BRFM310]|uniref:Uncharacterized protein n=1 Tax=Trametes coccinea (strain BRFM310) TaxID=1353009 RepID=A0A1Y2IR00_TRAC3|nr:hypothetical protein PYCCODRAFT_1467403 [Trametes coccinea BRFM310]
MQSPSQIAPPTSGASSPYGPLLLGTFIGLILYGLVVNQCTSYFYRFPTDNKHFKAFVGIILYVPQPLWLGRILFGNTKAHPVFHLSFAETLHSTLIVHWCYINLVTKYGHPEELALTTWSMNLFLVSSGLVVTITQFFYSYRVLVSTKYRILVAVAVVLALTTLGCAAAGTGLAFGAHTVVEAAARAKWVDQCGVITALITDVLNAGVLIQNLHKSRTGVRQITMMVMCIIGFFQKEEIILFGLGIVATKLYSNSVLATFVSIHPTPHLTLTDSNALARRVALYTPSLNSRRSPLDVDVDGAQSLPEVFLMSSDSLATDRDRDRAHLRGHRAGAVIDIARPPGAVAAAAAAAGTVTRLDLSASTLWKQDGNPDDSEDANGPRDAAMEGKVSARIV